MATIKLKFRASSVSGAEGTLYYQVIHRRTVRLISTGYHVYPCEWNDKAAALAVPRSGERRAKLLLVKSAIDWEMRQRKKVICGMEAADREFSVDELCEVFGGLAPCRTVFAFLQEQVARRKRMQRQGTARTYANAYLRFREFREGVDLTFDGLTPDLIEEYEAWLINRGLKQNTIRFYLRTLNTLLLRASGEGLLADARRLFCRVHLSYVKTTKRAVTAAGIRAIQNLSLPDGGIMAFARDVFMFSFYMRGMAFVDIAFLRKSDLRNGVLRYCRKKTNQQLAVEWEREPQLIVNRYSHLTEGSPFMLPIINNVDGTEYRQYQRMQENVNRALKKIGNMVGLKIPLTTYVARHSWASIARDMDIPIAIISEGMGHQSYKTTQVYLNSIDTARVDEANRNIIRRIRES